MSPRWTAPLRWALTRSTDRLAAGPARPAAGADILLVRLDAVGDFTLWLPAAEALRGLHQGRRTVLLANRVWSDLARALPYWDEVWSLDVPRFRRPGPYRWAWLRRLRRAGFVTAIQPTLSRECWAGDSAVWASAAPERVGAEGDCSNIDARQKARTDRWYSRLLGAAGAKSEVDRNRSFAEALGASPAAPYRLPAVDAPPSAAPAGPYAVLAPGAGSTLRRWPAERFAAVAAHLAQRGLAVLLCGSPGERETCRAVAAAAGTPLTDLCGRTTLPALAELIRGAALVVGNDSSPVHLAAAAGTPAVAVYGSGHFGRFLPYPPGSVAAEPRVVYKPVPCADCNWNCPYVGADEPGLCVARVGLDEVLAAVDQALESKGSAR